MNILQNEFKLDLENYIEIENKILTLIKLSKTDELIRLLKYYGLSIYNVRSSEFSPILKCDDWFSCLVNVNGVLKVFVNEKINLKNSRFAIALEFIHFMLEEKENIPNYLHVTKNINYNKDCIENYYVRALLMPINNLIDDLKRLRKDIFLDNLLSVVIANKYDVDFSVAYRRIEDIKNIEDMDLKKVIRIKKHNIQIKS